MKKKQLNDDSDNSSDTQSLVSTQNDQLKLKYQPHRRKIICQSPRQDKIIKKIKQYNHEDQQYQDWRTQFTKSIYNQSNRISTPQKIQKINQKYLKQGISIKQNCILKSCQKYQNLCSICLETPSCPLGLLCCSHKFCLSCIMQWTSTSTKCPCCRNPFKQITSITLKDSIQTKQIIKVQQKNMTFSQLDYYVCYVCNRGDDDHVLMICDMCDFYCCHTYCDTQLNNIFPQGDWFCRNCKQALRRSQQDQRLNMELTRFRSSNQIQAIRTQFTNSSSNESLLHRYYESDEESSSEQSNIDNQMSEKKKTMVTRSKARQIFQNNLPKSPKNRLNNVINRILSVNTNTSANLRNLRRIRRS